MSMASSRVSYSPGLVVALVLVPFHSMNVFTVFAIQLFYLRLGGFVGPCNVNGPVESNLTIRLFLVIFPVFSGVWFQ